MAKIIASSKEAKIKMQEGISLLTRAVSATIGPKGRNVLICDKKGAICSTKEGQMVAMHFFLKDRLQEIGSQIVKEAARRTVQEVGAAATTSIILAEAIYREGLKRVINGSDPLRIKKGLEKALEEVLKRLEMMSKPVVSDDELLAALHLAVDHDHALAKVALEAVKKVGKEGLISIKTGTKETTEISFTEGLTFERGYLSPYFVTAPERMECIFEDPCLFITNRTLITAFDVAAILERFLEKGEKALVIVAEEIEEEALATLVINKLKKGLQIAAVKTPLLEGDKREMLEDLCILTNATFVSKESGISLEKLSPDSFGKAKSILIDRDATTVIGGYADRRLLAAKAEEIKRRLTLIEDKKERERLSKRLSSLTDGAALIEVGGLSSLEAMEKKRRLHEALYAAKAALDGGVVVGGGIAYLKAAKSLGETSLSQEDDGVKILQEALKKPLLAIIKNAGEDGEAIVSRLLEESDYIGFNALTKNVEDLCLAKIIDPFLTIKTALTSAVSVASTLLTVETVIASTT